MAEKQQKEFLKSNHLEEASSSNHLEQTSSTNITINNNFNGSFNANKADFGAGSNQQSDFSSMEKLFSRAKNEIGCNKLEAAVNTTIEILTQIDCNKNKELPASSHNNVDNNMKSLISQFLTLEKSSKLGPCWKAVRRLLNERFELIEKYFKGETRLIKLSDIGLLMKKVSDQLRHEKKTTDIAEYFELMDKIFERMQLSNDVEQKHKIKHIARFLISYGCCCNRAKKFAYSIQINSQAIGLITSVFAYARNPPYMLGECHRSLGVAYKHLNAPDQAQQSLREAMKIFKKANDWTSSEKRQLGIDRINELLKELKLKTTNKK